MGVTNGKSNTKIKTYKNKHWQKTCQYGKFTSELLEAESGNIQTIVVL